MPIQDVIDDLKVIFGDQTEAVTNTATVTNSPSSLSREQVKEIADKIPLGPIFQQLGVFVANVVADRLQARSLRPADYAELPELPESLLERMKETSDDAKTVFAKSFVDALKARG